MRQINIRRTANMVTIAVLLVLLANIVTSLGVGPSRQSISFAPSQELMGELIIINDQSQDFKAAVYAQGELSNYVKIDEPLIDVKSGEMMKRVPYTITFPSTPPSPGTHNLELVVRQFPADADIDSGTAVSANLAVIAQIMIKVPYPGKYAEGKLYIGNNENPEDPISFAVSLYNFGTETIKEAHSRIEILGPLLGKIAEFNTDTKSVESKKDARLEASWMPSVKKGTYKARVTTYYDDKQFVLEQDFDIGSFVIEVGDIGVEKFRLGDVAKFDILLNNNWNTEVKDIYVEMTVENSEGEEMTKFKTSTIDIPAQQSGKLEAYWYTEGVAPGVYKVKLLVHYQDKLAQKEYDFEVNTNSITRLGAVGQAILSEEEAEQVTTQGLLIMLILAVIVLLLIMNGVWFYYIVKKLKGGDK